MSLAEIEGSVSQPTDVLLLLVSVEYGTEERSLMVGNVPSLKVLPAFEPLTWMPEEQSKTRECTLLSVSIREMTS